MTFLTVLLIWMSACGAITAALAHHKGRSKLGWFFLGFFLAVGGLLGLIAIVIAAVVPNLREQEEQQSRTRREARRLREQLRQEKAKNEAFRQHAASRLDAHDGALGLDTRQPAALPSPAAADARPPALLAGAAGGAAPGEPLWYYEAAGEMRGPVRRGELQRLLDEQRLKPATLVWNEELADWTSAARLPELAAGPAESSVAPSGRLPRQTT